jgi:hypothetical protein
MAIFGLVLHAREQKPDFRFHILEGHGAFS